MTPENAALSWLRVPLAVRFGIGAAVGFSLAFGVVVLDRLLNGYHDSLVEYVAWAASLALVAGVVLAYEERVRHNFGSFEQFIAYSRAFRAGKLPERIEPDVWRGWLSSSRRWNRMEPLRAGVLVVLGVLPSLINHSAYWVTASLFGLLAILSLVGSWQTRARIIRLTAEVEQRATRGSTV